MKNMLPRLLLIGDYSDEKQKELLETLYKKFNKKYEVFFSGYHINEISENYLEHSCKLNSNQYTYLVDMSENVIITDEHINYYLTKTNQQIIRFANKIDSIKKILFSNQLYIVTDALSFYDTIINILGDEHVFYSKENLFENMELVDWIDNVLGQDRSRMIDAIFFSPEKKGAEQRVDYQLNLFIDALGKYSKYNFGWISFGNDNYRYSNKITRLFNEDNIARVKKVLEYFEGIIIVENEEIKDAFFQWVNSNAINTRYSNVLTLNETKLFPFFSNNSDSIEYLLRDKSTKDDLMKYRKMLVDVYQRIGADKQLISVIMCRYNTPMDLLCRAIDSVLKSKHSNVELILVDDGSNDNIQEFLYEKYPDNRLKYYFKENEGLGLSRNYGITKSNGEVVFFLDTDDTITDDGLYLMLAHMLYFNLDLVCGKRVICDENGKVINESLADIIGDTYRIYGIEKMGEGINDVMVNNKLIRKKFIEDNQIWFKKGVYEDVEFTSRLYNYCSCFHTVNIRIHNWYQYETMDTLSSHISYNNFKERLIKTEDAWGNILENQRRTRLRSILNHEFYRYFANYSFFSEDEKEKFWNDIRSFIISKIDYCGSIIFGLFAKTVVTAAKENNFNLFEMAIELYVTQNKHPEKPHENFVAFTHYHVLVSIIYALESKKPTRLYLGKGYSDFEKDYVTKLKNTNIFEDIIEFSLSNGVELLYQDLNRRPEDADIIIPTRLNLPYRNIFSSCDLSNDNVYIFSDTHPYWYYIETHFANIIKLEDAYNSFDRELKPFEIWGKWGCIKPYIGSIYPEVNFKSNKINKIIISNPIEDLPDNISEKIEIRDTKKMAEQNKEKLTRCLTNMYDVDISMLNENSVMILTQPLALYEYCTKNEQRELYNRMAKHYPLKDIVIKPHPADKMQYTKYTVMNKNIPIEVLNFMDIRIKKAITFGSSAIETIEFAREKESFFPLHGFCREDVILAIKKQTKPTIYQKSKKLAKRLLRKC